MVTPTSVTNLKGMRPELTGFFKPVSSVIASGEVVGTNGKGYKVLLSCCSPPYSWPQQIRFQARAPNPRSSSASKGNSRVTHCSNKTRRVRKASILTVSSLEKSHKLSGTQKLVFGYYKRTYYYFLLKLTRYISLSFLYLGGLRVSVRVPLRVS